METHYDNESYWNRSSSKAFSFDDDDGMVTTTSLNSLDVALMSNATKKRSLSGTGGIATDDAISEASFENTTASALSLSIKTIISDEALKQILQEQTLDDRLLSKGVTPDEELRSLRRQIQSTLYSASPELTSQKLLRGKIVPLEVFKSLHEKEQLLDTLLKNGGGDTVVGVVLFLKRTLNTGNFCRILQQRPLVFQQYLSFLKQCHGEQAVQFLRLFGKQQEAALLQFHMLLKCHDIAKRKQQLRQLHESYSDTCVNNLYQQIFQANLKLLEFIESERNSLDNLVDLNSTPIEVLHACNRKHTNWKDPQLQNAISPFRFCQLLQISSAQFEWTVLNERTCAQAYADLEAVFERVPSWNPMKQKQFHISFSLELAILRLHQLKAPISVLYLFLSKMSNSQEKLELAQSVQCSKAVVDALLGLKQLDQLLLLKDTLPERSEEQFYCEKAIKTLQHKRWSTDNINLKLKL